MLPRIRAALDAQAGQSLLEHMLVIAPLTVLVALGVLIVLISGSM